MLLILSKMLKRLASDEDTLMLAKREAIIADLKRLVHINDEKNQLLIHMACQKVIVFFSLKILNHF